jgi:hypothetical protein
MTQLTVRGVDGGLHHFLQQEAERRGQSINRYVLSLLQEAAGVGNGDPQTPIVYHDLDHLAGTWAEQEYAEFTQDLAAQRGIDEELWR